MSELHYSDVRHDCTLPSTNHLPSYGEERQTIARFRCPECGGRWRYHAQFLDYGRFYWGRTSGPRWRWARAERRRLLKEAPSE